MKITNNYFTMETKPKVTVIIPARNEEKYIGQALGQLSSQDYPDIYEVIVVDNDSSDRTVEKAREFKIKVVVEKRRGVQFARERGRKEARGEILACLDADCVPPLNWLNKGATCFNNPRVMGVSGLYDYYDGHQGFRVLSGFLEKNVLQYIHFLVHDLLGVGGVMIGGNAFLRAKAMEMIGGFNTNITFYGDDTDTARRLTRTGRLLFKKDLVVKSSVRRFRNQGYINVLNKYFSNFLWVLLFKKPFSQ